MYDINSSSSLGGQFNAVARQTNSYNTLKNGHNDIMNAFSGGPVQQSVSATPDVTSISNKDFHLPTVNATSSQSVSAAGAKVVDTGGVRSDVKAVTADYMQTDRDIKTVVYQAMEQEFGRKDATQAMNQMLPGGGVTKMQAMATFVDPTGISGSVYAVLDTVISENKKLPNAKLNAMLETTFSRLQQASEIAQHGDMNEARRLVPEGKDFRGLNNWSELKEFLERNPENDPIMREARAINEAMDELDENNLYVQENNHRAGDLEEKALAAVAAGDHAGVREFTATEAEAEAFTAGEANLCGDFLGYLKNVIPRDGASVALNSEAKATLVDYSDEFKVAAVGAVNPNVAA